MSILSDGCCGIEPPRRRAMLPQCLEQRGLPRSLVKVEPGKPYVYYSGAFRGTRRSTDRVAWEAYVREQKPDFDPGKT
jgi:hypothetical protein